MKTRIKELRKSLKGWTQADLAEATGLSQSYIGAIESKNIAKSPSMGTLASIADALGVRIGELFDDAKPIPVVGTVGAGARVPLVDTYAMGDGMYHIARPFELRDKKAVGVEIEGDSMLPTYQNGDVLFYTRDVYGVPTEAVGRICVCEDENEDAWVKYVKNGSEPGRFHLISLNPLADNMFDVRLKWAAPVLLHWPRDLVEEV